MVATPTAFKLLGVTFGMTLYYPAAIAMVMIFRVYPPIENSLVLHVSYFFLGAIWFSVLAVLAWALIRVVTIGRKGSET